MLCTTVIGVVCFSALVSTGQTDTDVLRTPNAGSSLMLYFIQRVDKLYDQVKDLQTKISPPCRGGFHSIGHLTAEVEELKSEVRKRHIPAKEKEILVYFRAYLSVDKRFGVGKTVIFDKVDSNIGGGYNSTSGVFTAPVSGLYEFKCQLENMENGMAEYTIHHEGTGKAVLVLPGEWKTNHMSTIIRVSAGEKVWIYGRWDDGKKPLTRKGMWSQFTGYLLRKAEL